MYEFCVISPNLLNLQFKKKHILQKSKNKAAIKQKKIFKQKIQKAYGADVISKIILTF